MSAVEPLPILVVSSPRPWLVRARRPGLYDLVVCEPCEARKAVLHDKQVARFWWAHRHCGMGVKRA